MSAIKKTAAHLIPTENAAPMPNYRVLVVDDEKAIAEGIRSILVPQGENVVPLRRSSRSATPEAAAQAGGKYTFEVTVVHTAQDALKAAEDALSSGQPYAMGFFDVMLGGEMDGIELVKRVQAIDKDMFCVFVTAYNDRSVDSIDEYLGTENAERWDYINKPFSDGEILQKARNLVRMYNLLRQKEYQDEQLSEAHRMVLAHERLNTVSAVGRSVAHEFGNILMQIVGHADLALMKNDVERMKTALETILKASDTATHILGRFKKMAQTGEMSNEKKLVHLANPVNEALDLMSYQFRKHQVKVVKPQFDQVVLMVNHHSLVQVLMNLFINATHAMSSGGDLEVSIVKDGEYCNIFVKDNGTGIPEDILPKVTEPLFTTKGSQGTGLGLAISKEIVEIEHAGEFKISNHPKGGVEVQIRLPMKKGAA